MDEKQRRTIEKRTDVVGFQHTLGVDNAGIFKAGKIELRQYKNLEEKQKMKAEVLSRFKGQMFRSIIKPREIDGNKRLDKLERMDRKDNKSDIEATIKRADSFGAKKKETISTFPTTLTFAYCMLLSEEGDKVLDLFMGHNGRASDIVSINRKYYGWDVHKFPYEFTQEALKLYSDEDYNLHLGSSEKLDYPDDFFDFAFTCPPYAWVEDYNKIYEEKVDSDLSGKDYSGFLRGYKRCLSEGFRTLKQGKFFVIIIGNAFKQGKMFNLMKDTIDLCELIGFVTHDINIYNRGSNIGFDLNPKLFLTKLKRFGQIHEYILIFRKPEVGVVK